MAKKNGYLEVILPSGHKTLIDTEDEWILKIFPNWRIHFIEKTAKAVMVTRYLKSEYGAVREDRYLHRIIMHKMGLRSAAQVDHKDRNPLNNRKDNLRWVTASQNTRNAEKMSKNFTSKHRGVFKNNWTKSERWCSQIKMNGRAKHLGSFKTEKEAAIAYNLASQKLYGKYGWQNQI